MKTRIDVERIHALRAELRALNCLELRDIDFYENGVQIEISLEMIDRFQITALANMDFVDFEFWKEDPKDWFKVGE